MQQDADNAEAADGPARKPGCKAVNGGSTGKLSCTKRVKHARNFCRTPTRRGTGIFLASRLAWIYKDGPRSVLAASGSARVRT